jgi:hypothetical protein
MATQDFLIQGPDLGLNDLLPSNMLDPREAAEGSSNVLYEYGIMRTPYGFAKLDLSSPIGGGANILKLFNYKEYDGYTNLLAVTPQKIYVHNQDAVSWTDKMPTGESLQGSIYNPVSFVEYPHQDGVRRNNASSGTDYSYQHVIVCDGEGFIYRWAGRYENTFYKLAGGNGYHAGTSIYHKAKFIASNRSRLILLSPLIQNASGSWIENNTRVQWPMAGMLEATTAAGSTSAWATTNIGAGFVDLMDTGGTNVCAYNLGGTLYIYQTQGIWALNYVGGSSVFSPLPMIPDVGIMGPSAICVKNNVHYFVGKDSNVYAYYGGTSIERIGDKISKYLREDIEYSQAGRTMMVSDTDNKRIWVFVVPNGGAHMTKAYGMDLRTGAWMIRDFADVFGTTSGVTAAALTGASRYEIGGTYRDLLNKLSTYTSKGTGYSNIRYGDYLLDNSIKEFTGAAGGGTEISSGTWSNGGLSYDKAAADFTNYLADNDIFKVDDGSNGTNVEPGTHFYTIYDVSTACFRVEPRTNRQMYLDFMNGQVEFTIGANIYDYSVPANYGRVELCIKEAGEWTAKSACGRLVLTGASGDISAACTLMIDVTDMGATDISAADSTAAADVTMTVLGIGSSAAAIPSEMHMGEVTGVQVTSYRPDGQTYKETQQTILKKETMVIGGSNGYIYEFSDSLTTDDGTASVSVHYTPFIDLQEPEKYKVWRKFVVEAKGSSVAIEYSLDEGQTWVYGGTLHLALSRFDDYPFYIYKSSKSIQFRFTNDPTCAKPNLMPYDGSKGWRMSLSTDNTWSPTTDPVWDISKVAWGIQAGEYLSFCRTVEMITPRHYKISFPLYTERWGWITPLSSGNSFSPIGSDTIHLSLQDYSYSVIGFSKSFGFDSTGTNNVDSMYVVLSDICFVEDFTKGSYQIRSVKAVDVAIEGAK